MDKPIKFIQSNKTIGRNRQGRSGISKGVERQDIKTQKFASSNTVYTQPHFYSPLHTPQNWQIPSRREEIYQWQIIDGQLLTEQGTYVNIEDFEFIPEEIIEDAVTGGLLYNNIESQNVITGKGNLEFPTKFSVRECIEKECYKFSSTGQWRNFSVSEEHGIYVIDGDDYRKRKKIKSDKEYCLKLGKKLGWAKIETSFLDLVIRKEAKDVKLNDYLLIPVRKFVENAIILNTDLAWSIGLLQADGHLSHSDNGGYNTCYTLNKNEVVCEKIKTILEKFTKNKVQYYPHTNSKQSKRIILSEKEHYNKIAKYTIGKHSEKCFTKDIFDLDKESMMHVLGGYIDGDGSFNKAEEKIIINCYSENMSDQLQQMFLMCGVKCSLKRYPLYGDHYKTNSKWCYKIFISSSEIPKIIPYLRSDKMPEDFIPKTTRELRFFYEEDGNIFVASPIEKIEKFLYSGPGYDIEIPIDRSYCCSGFYVSNCRFFVENEPKVAAAIQFYCFDPDVPILMADGEQKSISSIKIGSNIRSHDGSINKVINKYVRHADEKMMKVSVAGINIRSLRMTPGHEVLTDVDGKICFKQIGTLKKGDYLLTPINYGNEESNFINNDLAWLLGAYAAEGCGIPYEHISKIGVSRQYYKGVYFTIHSDEKETFGSKIIEKLKKLYGDCNITSYELKDKNAFKICAYGQSIADDLIGLCPGNAKDGEKRFSPLVMNLNHKNLTAILGGFMSGDGCFAENNGFQGVGVSKKLCDQIANICDKLGLEYSYSKTRISLKNRQVIYNIRISRWACECLQEYTHKIPNKSCYEKNGTNIPYFKKGNYIYRRIKKIEEFDYSGDVYDLEIENKHSYVANRIAVHNSEFPMQGFELQCGDPKIKRYYEELNKRLSLNYWLPIISSEYYLLGDAFPFLTIQCKKCGGSGVYEDKECDHQGGTFSKLTVFNPDWIDVKENSLFNEPYIQLKPNEELRRIVTDRQPVEIYNRIPEHIRIMVMAGQPIPLSNRAVTHLKHMPTPISPYGTSIIRRLFKTLAYKDRLMTANWIVAERLILPIRIIKIGNDDRPAGAIDIANVQEQIAAVMNDPNLTLVTHHAFTYEFVGAQGQIVQLGPEYEMITGEILDGLMLPQAVLTSEMQGYQGVQIGAEILITRLENWRNKLKNYIEESIYLPVAKMQGFIDEDASKDLGDIIYTYPEIKWNDLKIRDDTQRKQQYLGLHDAGIISTQTLSEIFDLDYDQEIERKREEVSIQMSLGGGNMGGMGAMGGGMGGMPPMGGGGPMGGGAPPMPGGEMGGMPPMPGGEMGGMTGAPGGEMGGGIGGASSASRGPGTEGKILKRKTKSRIDRKSEQQQQQLPEVIQLTSIEKILWRRLFSDPSIEIPFPKYAQFKVANTQGQSFVLDFAIPHLKIGIEADGALHQLDENKTRDVDRDQRLARKGWWILRFNEREIENKTEQVIQTIMKYVSMRMQMIKKESSSTKEKVIGTITQTLDSLTES